MLHASTNENKTKSNTIKYFSSSFLYPQQSEIYKFCTQKNGVEEHILYTLVFNPNFLEEEKLM